jgi:hypothetical protein
VTPLNPLRTLNTSYCTPVVLYMIYHIISHIDQERRYHNVILLPSHNSIKMLLQPNKSCIDCNNILCYGTEGIVAKIACDYYKIDNIWQCNHCV